MTSPDAATANDPCGPEPGQVVPVIDRNRCEGKADCVTVCPYDVFTIAQVTAEDRAAMSFVGKLKLTVHGGRQAYAVNATECHACGLCVAACPESAISLLRSNRPDR